MGVVPERTDPSSNPRGFTRKATVFRGDTSCISILCGRKSLRVPFPIELLCSFKMFIQTKTLGVLCGRGEAGLLLLEYFNVTNMQ